MITKVVIQILLAVVSLMAYLKIFNIHAPQTGAKIPPWQ